jgi:acyl carrier protein
MGLDAVELVMEVEERFDVRIADDEVLLMRTLGDLHDVLLEKCAGQKRTGCATRTAFYRLRRVVGQVLGVNTDEMRPSTPMLPLLGRWRRGRTWRRLQRELGWQLPPLENRAGRGVFWGMATLGIGTFLAIAVTSRDLCLAAGVALVALLPGTLLGYVVGVLWIPTLPPPFYTAGGLARAVVALNASEFRHAAELQPADDPIWNRLCDVLVEQLGVEREALRRDTRFVEDLSF